MKLLSKTSTKKGVGVLTVLFLGGYLFLNAFEHPFSILTIKELSQGHTILNVLPYYDANMAYAHLLSYPQEAVSIYKRILLFDSLLLIPIYVLFFASTFIYLSKRLLPNRKGLHNFLAVIPFIVGLLNYIEDGLVLYLLTSIPEKHEAMALLCGYFTTSKTILISFSLITIILMFLISSAVRILNQSKVRKLRMGKPSL